MKKQRTLCQKLIIAIKNILVVIGVGSFILDFANDYTIATFTIKIVLLGGCLWIFFKADEIINREVFDEKFELVTKERSCIRNVLNYKEYQSKNNFRVTLGEDFNAFISINNCFTVKISRDKFLGLSNKQKIEELDNYIADHVNKSLSGNLSKSAAEMVLEIAVSNYLNKLT